MKKIISILLAVVMLFSLTACGGSQDVTVNVYALKGPTGVGILPMVSDSANGKTQQSYNINLVGANDEIVAKLSNKEADIAAVATNLASTLYNKLDGEITVLAVNTLGVLSLVAKGEDVTSIKDLKGKTVYTTGQGANPEYIARYILSENGLTVGEDVELKFVSEGTELVSYVTTNEKAIVIAPQPVATTIAVKDEKAQIILDMNDEWDAVSDTELVMGCIVVRNEFLEKNPEAVKTFLEEYSASIDAVNADTAAAAALCEEYGLIASAAIAKLAIPYCNIVYQDGETMKTNLSAYLNFLYGYNPASVGGTLPNDSFYYVQK